MFSHQCINIFIDVIMITIELVTIALPETQKYSFIIFSSCSIWFSFQDSVTPRKIARSGDEHLMDDVFPVYICFTQNRVTLIAYKV